MAKLLFTANGSRYDNGQWFVHIGVSSIGDVRPFSFWIRGIDLDSHSLKPWLWNRWLDYHVVAVEKVNGPKVTLILEAAIAVDCGITAKSTDSLENWLEEWKNVDGMEQVVLPVINEWRDRQPNRALNLPHTLGERRTARGRRLGQQLVHDPICAQVFVLLPKADAIPLVQRFRLELEADAALLDGRVEYVEGYDASSPPAIKDRRFPHCFDRLDSSSTETYPIGQKDILRVLIFHSTPQFHVRMDGWKNGPSLSPPSILELMEAALVPGCVHVQLLVAIGHQILPSLTVSNN